MKKGDQVLGIFSILAMMFVIGCESGTETKANEANPDSTPKVLSQAPPKDGGTPSFQFFGVLREFGGKDTGALFGVVSGGESVQISKVDGPSFLGGYRVGELSAQSVQSIFANSAQPLSPDERSDLISKYNGAAVAYFEGYSGELCSNTEFKMTFVGTVNAVEYTFMMDIIAEPNPSGDCTFHQFLTCYGPTGEFVCSFPS